MASVIASRRTGILVPESGSKDTAVRRLRGAEEIVSNKIPPNTGNTGDKYTDFSVSENLSAVSAITVWVDAGDGNYSDRDLVKGIKVQWANGQVASKGEEAGTSHLLNIQSDEKVTSLSVWVGDRLDRIRLTTDKKKGAFDCGGMDYTHGRGGKKYVTDPKNLGNGILLGFVGRLDSARLISLAGIFEEDSDVQGDNPPHVTMKISPVKTVVEYPLPAAGQTHEILAVSDALLLISQQTDGSLVKVALDTNGRPTGARKWAVANPWSGLHGLALQSTSCGPIVWATVQFDNVVLQIDPNGDDINAEPQVTRIIPLPSPASGPHGVLENNGNLWISCKNSSHVVRISISKQDDYQIWAVSGRPIFIAVHPTSQDVFSGLDMSSKIWHYKNDGESGQEIAIPPERGTTPVGLVAGPDDNVWVALLGNSTTGTGTFGRINKDASIDWFTMSSAIGSTASLIHMAFDREHTGRLWMLGSSIACASSVNAIFTVNIDDISTGGTAKPRIARQNSIVLPTQRSAAHRVISHNGSLYVTELTTSTLAHISGAAVDGLDDSETWDQFADYGLGLKAVYSSYDNTA